SKSDPAHLHAFPGSHYHRFLPASPTRRSSDLEGPAPGGADASPAPGGHGGPGGGPRTPVGSAPGHRAGPDSFPYSVRAARFRQRSEEHTSELQSRENLVCRLLLEKKKTINTKM